jgi:hypothetical protein
MRRAYSPMSGNTNAAAGLGGRDTSRTRIQRAARGVSVGEVGASVSTSERPVKAVVA